MTSNTTDIVLSEQALTEYLIDELDSNKRMCVVVDHNDLAWPRRFEDEARRSCSLVRTRRYSTGYRTVEVIGSSTVDIITTRSVNGGAGRGKTYDLVVIPVDASDDVAVMAYTTTVPAEGQVLRHEGLT